MMKKLISCILTVFMLIAAFSASVCAANGDVSSEAEETADRMLAERGDRWDLVVTLSITAEDIGSADEMLAVIDDMNLPYPAKVLGNDTNGNWMLAVTELFEDEFRDELIALLSCETVISVEFDNLPKIPEPNHEPGDVNRNGILEPVDYLMLRRYLTNTYELTHDRKLAADVNNDHRIDASDYLLLRRILVNGD